MRRVAVVSTYPPARCGIATYTRNLVEGLACTRLVQPFVAAAWRQGLPPATSTWQFDVEDRGAYRNLAASISETCEVALIQHEYGIYGGPDGAFVLELLTRLEIPAVLGMHTIVTPTAHLKALTEKLVLAADGVIVPTARAGAELVRNYGPVGAPIRPIAHGVRYAPTRETSKRTARRELGIGADHLLVSTGFLTQNKGVHQALEAVAELRDRGLDVQYALVGGTHPHDAQGDVYLARVRQLIRRYNLDEAVHLVHAYVSDSLLDTWISAADACVLPYTAEEQASSGVLSRCLGMGKAVVCSRFSHAVDLLQGAPEALVPIGDVAALSDAIFKLITDEGAMRRLENVAAVQARNWTWESVGGQHLTFFDEIM